MSRLTASRPERALPRIPWRPLALLLVIAIAIRTALLPLYAYLPENFLDETAWKLWMEQIHLHGFINILRYDNNNYLGYHWILWILASIYDVVGGPYTQTTPSLHILVKMPPLFFDVALTFAVYFLTMLLIRDEETDAAGGQRRLLSGAQQQRLAVVAAAVILFHPAVIYDSAIWAQIDAITTAAELTAIIFIVRGKPFPGWMAWTVGFMLKPHPIIIAPLLALITLRQNRWRGAVEACGGVALVAGVVLGPWLLHGDFHRIIRIYRWLFHENLGKLSLSAWNFWWFPDVATKLNPDQKVVSGVPFFTYRNTGLGLSMIALAIACAYWWAKPGMKRTLVSCAYLAVAFYMLPISTHERYIYPFVGMMLPVAIIDRRWLWLYVPISATFFINLFFAAPPVHSWAGRWLDGPFSLAIASINVVLFFAFTYVTVKGGLPALIELRDFVLRRLRALREPEAAMESA
jgi:Gpi18-like mannosyltransferase